jgi:hypothetical protein
MMTIEQSFARRRQAMTMTSAAEAKLDARIRPEITALRSRTPYPGRRPAATTDVTAQPEAAAGQPVAVAGRPEAVAGRPEAVSPPRRARPAPAASSRTPVRLTRRGRIVVGTIAVIGTAAVASLIWLAVTGQAQASGYTGPGAPVRNSMLKVVVRPGQTLWSIAVDADPASDPRAVIPQIMDINSLPGSNIMPGQVLWVPKG